MARRSKGDGSIYQRADGKWVGSIEIGWRDGKRRRRTVTADTRRDVALRLRKLAREVEAGAIGDDITVEHWMAHWLDEICPARGLKPSTIYGYRSKTATWITPTIGRILLRKLTPQHVRNLHKRMRDDGKAEATVRQVHAILSRALTVAEREQRVSRNVAALVDAPSIGDKHHEALTVDQAKAVLAAAPTPRELARHVCALILGLRRGEALALRWRDVDLEHGLMRVQESVDWTPGNGAQLGTVKSQASDRIIPLPAGVVGVLARLRQEDPHGDWLFPGPDGNHQSHAKSDWKQWRDALVRAGVPHVPHHGARASAASLLMEMGVPDRVIADILGHADVQITKRAYLRSNEDQRRKALDGAFRELLPLPQ